MVDLTMFVLVWNRMKVNLGEYAQRNARFPTDLIVVVICPTNCLEGE
jgi:hypothetical protein